MAEFGLMVKKKNVLFLSYGEDFLQNKILQNQFINWAKKLNTNKYNVFVHSFLPISRTRLFQSKLWKKELHELQQDLQNKNIPLTYSYLPGLASWLYSHFLQFFFFHNLLSYAQLLFFIKKNDIQYIYCRSYHSTFAALLVKKLFALKYIVHFDPRSLFVEEGQYLGRISNASLYLWNRIESFLYTNADLVTFVSKPFQAIQKAKFPIKRSEVIYTHVNVDDFSFDPNKKIDTAHLCYLGQLDDSGWHQSEKLFELYSSIAKKIEATLTIVTRSPHAPIKEHIQRLQLKNVNLYAAQNTKEVSRLLKNCNVSLISYKTLNSELEKTIAQTVVASKSGEYLAAGLPILCFKELRGIAELIETHHLGATYTFGNEARIVEDLQSILENYSEISARCREFAENNFSLENNAQKLENEIDTLCAQ
jgi:glycosyltransferase involved in cell wall biosynthesis